MLTASKASPSSSDCLTCYGLGEVATENGPVRCPDCVGEGVAPNRYDAAERRLQELDGAYAQTAVGGAGQAAADVRWLVFELRQCRDVLMRILTRSQDADDRDPFAIDVRSWANEALGLYEPVPITPESK